jgi:hypothetical protein
VSEWKKIETAPHNRMVRVSMRDVDRPPPEWKAQKRRFLLRPPHPRYRHIERYFWIAEDGFVCAPTHWLSPYETATTKDHPND